MSPCLEFEGKNIERSSKKACKELNIPESLLKHDIISFGSSGIFGIVGAKKARIRVKLPKATTEPKIETQTKEKNFTSNNEKEIINEKETIVTEKESSEDDKLHKQPVPISDDDVNDDDVNDDDDDGDDDDDDGGDDDGVSSEDAIDLGRNALNQIIDLITTDAQVTLSEQPNKILFTIEGGNSALLIGKRGQTLEAIQYIVSKIINKHHENRIRVIIDVEGYLESKRVNLIERSLRLAEKVQETGKPVTIGIMNGHDRRIVHLALKEHKAVTTKSFGDDFFRKLVIFPKRKNANKKKT